MLCIDIMTGQIVRLFQILSVYGVYSYCDQTDNKVISDIVGIWFV